MWTDPPLILVCVLHVLYQPQHPFFYFSYHQKYLLRQQRDILKALDLSDAEVITSHVACRLNGYCGGYGTVAELEKEMPGFKLPEKVQERVRGVVARGRFH